MKIQSRSSWGAAAPRETPVRIPEAVAWVIIHHSGAHNDCAGRPCQDIVRNIQHYHINDRKWADIGYNFLVSPQGEVFEGRGWGVVGAHAPDYNSKSVGICLIGDYKDVVPPEAPLNATQYLISEGVRLGKIKSEYKLVGHRQVRSTSCPGDELYSIIQEWPHYTNNL